MENLDGDGAAVKAIQRTTKLVKNSRQMSRDDTPAKRELDHAIDDTSRRVLAWAQGAAAAAAAAAPGGADRQREVFPSALLASCCKYMEALATAFPARFSAECQSLATPVASCAQQLMRVHATGAAVPDGEADAEEKQRVDAESPPQPPPPSPVAERGGGGRENGGACEAQPPPARGNSLTIEERKALELWVDMLGICLLPFCGGGSGGGAARAGNGEPSAAAAAAAAAGSEQFDDPLKTDSEDDDDDDDDGNGGGGVSAGGKARSGLVTGWMRRAGVSIAEPPECPLDIRPGGRDEGLPYRLAVLAASHAKAAAAASRPASVSSLATALAVLVAATAPAGGGVGAGAGETEEERDGVGADAGGHGHAAVVEEAFSCLVGLCETVPESTAQAECVQFALVSLKECVQAARLVCLERRVPGLLSTLNGVPPRLKPLVARSKSGGPKAFSTAVSFCREALAAAVACARKLIGRAGAAEVAADPGWFLGTFVVRLASPMLLGDAVGALRRAAAEAPAATCSGEAGTVEVRGTGSRAAQFGMLVALRMELLPGAVVQLTKAVGCLERYSVAAARDVLKATVWLIREAGGEVVTHRRRLGMALVECAVGVRRSGPGGGSDSGMARDYKLSLCLRAISHLAEATAPAPFPRAGTATAARDDPAAAADNFGDGGPGASLAGPAVRSSFEFAEAALDLTCGIVESEWVGKRGEGGAGGESSEGSDTEESIVTLVQAHVTLEELLRSPSMRVAGVGPTGEWPSSAKRLARLAWAVAYRVRKEAGAVEASMALGDDDVMLLCQGLEVLEALDECSSEFFEGQEKLLFFSGDLSPVLTTLRGCRDKNNMHPVVYDACSWLV